MRWITMVLYSWLFSVISLNAGTIEKTYYFGDYKISNMADYRIINFENTLTTGKSGEPVLPYHPVSLLLPPGQIAQSIEIIGMNEITIPGNIKLYPQQYSRPLSAGRSNEFVKNEMVYSNNAAYPFSQTGHLTTEFMNGYAFALSTFTPVKYNPVTGTVSFFSKVVIRITTVPGVKAFDAQKNLSASDEILRKVRRLAQNPELISAYPHKGGSNDDYQMLIITPPQFVNNYSDLIELYLVRGIITKIITTDSIYTSASGQDSPEKIRNFIIQEYQNHDIEYVLLGGDVELVPYRGFYCKVQSSSVYESDNIPADLYYSALDGTWNTDGDNLWGEIGEEDLLPEVSVARLTISSATDLNNMLNKIISYQNNPVLGELDKPLLAGEHLWSNPLTWGGDYLDLLIGTHNDSGYTTTGIPANHNIEKLYDRDIGYWEGTTLITKINEGKSFIHHVGHANSYSVMRLSSYEITNTNFAQVNGSTHNYTLVYTHGCDCGAFDQSDCIAEEMVKIEKFAAAFVGNSRYGWFNEGQTEGPSQHLHREFVDALYSDKLNRIGTTHLESKIMTAPWVTAPGQWEEGAQRWCFYDCN
ncbi:MAG: hypothetical protein KAS18_00525, partial [Calditrichia bacterium]|nr:hypothetical protein [Calditrichia bacterium]